VPGGRPTKDPKETLVAVRLGERQRVALEQRARREGIALSEALRRCVDEWAATSQQGPRGRPPTREERKTFDQVFAAIGLRPRHRARRT